MHCLFYAACFLALIRLSMLPGTLGIAQTALATTPAPGFVGPGVIDLSATLAHISTETDAAIVSEKINTQSRIQPLPASPFSA